MNNYDLNIDNLLNKYMRMQELCAKNFEGDKSEHDFVLTGMGKVLNLVMQDLAALTNKTQKILN